MVKDGVKIFAKVFLGLICAVSFVLVSLIAISPDFSSKLYGHKGSEKGLFWALTQKYEKTGSAYDLYNVIEQAAKLDDYKNVKKYVGIMQGRSDFKDFSLKIDEAAAQAVDLKYLYLVHSYEGYLKQLMVRSTYVLEGFDAALGQAARCLADLSSFDFELKDLVDLVVTDDKLNAGEILAFLEIIANYEIGGKTVFDLTIHKIDTILGSGEISENSDMLGLQVAYMMCDTAMIFAEVLEEDSVLQDMKDKKALILSRLEVLWD